MSTNNVDDLKKVIREKCKHGHLQVHATNTKDLVSGFCSRFGELHLPILSTLVIFIVYVGRTKSLGKHKGPPTVYLSCLDQRPH
jgi:hypothetical protein